VRRAQGEQRQGGGHERGHVARLARLDADQDDDDRHGARNRQLDRQERAQLERGRGRRLAHERGAEPAVGQEVPGRHDRRTQRDDAELGRRELVGEDERAGEGDRLGGGGTDGQESRAGRAAAPDGRRAVGLLRHRHVHRIRLWRPRHSVSLPARRHAQLRVRSRRRSAASASAPTSGTVESGGVR